MKRKRSRKAPENIRELRNSNITLDLSNNIILKKFDEKVKYQYELIRVLEIAKTVTKFQLLSMIQEVKEDIGNSWLIAKLWTIYDERFV